VPRTRKRLRVLILEAGALDRPFYTILAANVRRWGYEAVVLSTEGMKAAGGRREIEGDILLYDMDAPLQPVVVWGNAEAAALSDVEQLTGQQTWPKVRLVIALSSRSVSRHSLEKVGAIALLHKPFDMRYLERYLRVFQQLLFMESAEVEALERSWQRGRRQATAPTFRILVADDRRDVTGTIRQCLVEQGTEQSRYEVREAHDGLELLEQCLLWRPHCVVTDVLMPWLNGYQVMRCLADCTRQPLPVFVVISALMQHELPVNRSYLREPVVLYVDKPFEVDNVLTVIEQALVRFP
jgi:two-component system alkaline phosphatase synthesis response regulator PhoP/two-component system response regulator VicR